MEVHNSLSTYVEMFEQLYLAIADMLSLSRRDTELDLQKVRFRISSEGFSFLTKTLPRLGKAFDKALLGDSVFPLPGLKKAHGSETPKLFGNLWKMVFTVGGTLLESPSTDAIRHLRTLCYFLYKVEMPYDKATSDSVISSFVATDAALEAVSINNGSRAIQVAKHLTSQTFKTFDPTDIEPKHGPGAVATGEKVHEKHFFSRIYSKLERVYPLWEYFVMGWKQVQDDLDRYKDFEELSVATARVCLVPKDSRGPRIISCEPLELMWIQQGLGNQLKSHIERHPLTRGHVNFVSQEINRRLALSGSASQEWVTLDMKEASDRVSVELVNTLFAGCPDLIKALYACRSDQTRLPDGTHIELLKFAPMGSNLCFPIQAFSFYALCVGAIVCEYGVTRREARESVFVYGDDIIVRQQYYPAVLRHLPFVGLLFNKDKCCTTGFFRESCGCDAYKGVDVTPLRLKKVWCHRSTISADIAASYVGFCNQAFKRGYYRLAGYIREMVEQRLGPLPEVPVDFDPSGLAWTWQSAAARGRTPGVAYRFRKRFQRLEARTYVVRPVEKSTDPDNWSTILRVRNNRSTPDSDSPNVGTYALPRRSCLQRGWITVP